MDSFTGDPGGDPGGSIPAPEADGDTGAWDEDRAEVEVALGEAGEGGAFVAEVVVRAAASPASCCPVCGRPSFGVGNSASAPARSTICMSVQPMHMHREASKQTHSIKLGKIHYSP